MILFFPLVWPEMTNRSPEAWVGLWGAVFFWAAGRAYSSLFQDLDLLGIGPVLNEIGAVAVGDQGVFPQHPDELLTAQGQLLGHVWDGLAVFGQVLDLSRGHQVHLVPIQAQAAVGEDDLLRGCQVEILPEQADADVCHHQLAHVLRGLAQEDPPFR